MLWVCRGPVSGECRSRPAGDMEFALELLCGGCGNTLTVDDDQSGEVRCARCGRMIPIPSMEAADRPNDEASLLVPLDAQEDFADEFLTKAKLALKKKLLVVCGSCDERLTVHQRLAGKVARCPACGGQIRIPAPTYEEPATEEDLMAEAAAEPSVLDAGERETPGWEAPVGVPHRAPPDAAATGAAPARKQRSRLVRVVVSIVALAGSALLGLLLGRTLMSQSKPAPPRPDERGAGAVKPVYVPPTATAPRTGPAETGPADKGPALEVVRARVSVLGAGGAVPAPLNKAYVLLTARLRAGERPLQINTAGGDVVLDIVKERLVALGVDAAGANVAVAAWPERLSVPAGEQREATFVFLAPADLAVGTLEIAGLGEVPLPSLPKVRTVPAEALAGTYVEDQRRLRLEFEDPVMEALRAAPAQRLEVKPDKDAFALSLSPAAVSGVVRTVGEGVYTAALTDGSNRLKCHLRLVAGGDRLVLYLTGEPFGQIIYRRK